MPFSVKVQSLVYGRARRCRHERGPSVTVSAGSTSWAVTIPTARTVDSVDTRGLAPGQQLLLTASRPEELRLRGRHHPGDRRGQVAQRTASPTAAVQSAGRLRAERGQPDLREPVGHGGTGSGAVLLSTSAVRQLPRGAKHWPDLPDRKGKSTLVAQTLVDLGPGRWPPRSSTATSRCAATAAWRSSSRSVDKGNTGDFVPRARVPGEGRPRQDQEVLRRPAAEHPVQRRRPRTVHPVRQRHEGDATELRRGWAVTAGWLTGLRRCQAGSGSCTPVLLRAAERRRPLPGSGAATTPSSRSAAVLSRISSSRPAGRPRRAPARPGPAGRNRVRAAGPGWS